MSMARETARATDTPGPATARKTPKQIFVQRFLDNSAVESAADPAALVVTAVASPATPLDTQTRAFMEPRFGHDFSRVRIHDDPAATRTARALHARAFTVGDHILFGAGHYSPATTTGKRMLAHELAHVVQQRSGVVTGRSAPDGMQLSDPADRFERAAERVANAVMSPGALMSPGTAVVPPGRGPASRATPAPVGPIRIQRFLAGEDGHGGIEEDALRDAGLSEAEAHRAYFGNWLRDFSQILDAQSPGGGAALEIIKILATGEFGRSPTDAELGRYLPSEHVDNPGGGKSAENPDIDATTLEQRRLALSPAQREWLRDEQTQAFKDTIKDRAATSGLPEYIERAKEHAKRQIAAAAALGRNEQGLRALGDGLHAVEDYFAHSNFIEVAVAQLRQEGELADDNPALLAARKNIQVDPANLQVPIADIGTDKFGRPEIVTGTSSPGAGDTVGTWEAIKTELRNHEIRQVFLRGAVIRYGWEGPKKVGRSIGSSIGGAIGGALGAVGGAIGGLFMGAGAGAALGWSGTRHWWQKPFAAIGGLFTGAFVGAAAGANAGFQSGRRVGGRIGGDTGGFFGRAASLGVAPAVAAVVFSLLTLLTAGTEAAGSKIEAHARRKIQQGTRDSVTERDPRLVPLPTHSQIAKDDPEHPLHAAAAHLAHVADENIGKKMIQAWANSRDQQRVADVQALIDVYLAHPEAGDWWKRELLSAVKGRK